ncbi:anti-sigma F factor [soil metagenome]
MAFRFLLKSKRKIICFLDINYAKLLTYKDKLVAEKSIELKLPSRIESIDEAVTEAIKFASGVGMSDEELYAIDMAMRESVANAVKHGNLLDETKPVEISLRNSADGFEVSVRDFGKGFAVEEIPDPTNPENLLKANGRGILFIRTFMDEVEWVNHAGGGTIIKMLKKH